ncbi:MAG: thiamine pyrophosphate-dependent enzyme [Thermodesulfobacteriota bacterium]
MNNSLLNPQRPPVFCPGCTHDRIVHEVDLAIQKLNLNADQVVLVSDIGCSGLFDTFFKTHAFHGLHGRALTYAAGLKMARPDLTVIVTMGDGGIGIGGAHFLAACRRNLDLTLLILNNFNFGMTGGQFSVTTPPESQVGSGFLNRLERPLDICETGRSAGAAYLGRYSGFQKDLAEKLAEAIRYPGFSVIDIWGICPGRYTKKNKLSIKTIETTLEKLDLFDGPVKENMRKEYFTHYRELAGQLPPPLPPLHLEAAFEPLPGDRHDLILMGDAGQRILTAGEILCLAGMTAGMRVSQKNEYNITVLRGPSISEIILAKEQIGYTGIETPSVLIAVGREGIGRRKSLFARIPPHGLIITGSDLELPPVQCKVLKLDFQKFKISPQDRALAAIGALAKSRRVIHMEMLQQALELRFGSNAPSSLELISRVSVENP